jgi:predicted dehydrogenase
MKLAVRGPEALRQQLAARLRGATIVPLSDSGPRPAPDECDALALLASSPTDAELVVRWLGAGRHVLLVAQPWITAPEIERFTAAASGGAQLAVMSAVRFLPSRQLIRQQLDAGRLGDPGLVRIRRWAGREPGDASTAGPLAAPLVEDVDFALWLIGQSPDVVYAVEEAVNGREDRGDLGDRSDDSDRGGRSTQLHLGFPAGGMALLDYSDQLPPGDGYQALSLIGSTGAAYVDDQQNSQLLYRGGQPQAVRVDERGREHLALVQSFVADLQQGRDLSASASSWQTVLAVAEAGRQSIASRRAVPLEAR